jgi:general secretion pathway protein M
MSRSLSAREQRALALGLLGTLLVSIYWLFVHIWFVAPLMSIDEQLSVLNEQDQRYSAVLARRDTLLQSLQDTRTRARGTVSLLPGDDPAAVAAELMQRVTEQVKKVEAVGAGCIITQRMPIANEPPGEAPYRPVSLSLDLDCGIEPLVRLLYALEYGKPLLFVDEMNISRASPDGAKAGTGKLTVHLLVAGYMSPSPLAASESTIRASEDDTSLPAADAVPGDEGAEQ